MTQGSARDLDRERVNVGTEGDEGGTAGTDIG
jgi:hypothetical protein